ncbi:MAG: hypothetical protein WCA46_14350 [Actinocatenispora sp.]
MLRRASGLGLLCVMLVSFVLFGGVRAHAGPALPAEVPSIAGADWSKAPQYPPYDYPSVAFWRSELTWDSPDLLPANLTRIKPPKAYKGKVGTKDHLLSRWKAYVTKAKLKRWGDLTDQEKKAAWEEYLDAYTGMLDNKARGKAFEEYYEKKHGLAHRGYVLDQMLRRHFSGVTGNRRGDAFRPGQGGVLFEFKSGSSPIDREQARFYARVAADNGKALVYVFGSQPRPEDLKFLDELNAEMARTTGHHDNVLNRSWPATGNPVRHPNAPPPPAGTSTGGSSPTPPGPPGSVAAQGQYDAGGAADDAIATSPSSPQAAAALADLEDGLAEDLGYHSPQDAGMPTQQLGGVDFSTLELRYVTDTYSGGFGSGMQYAYQVDGKPGEKVSYGGRAAAQLASDSFFTWLALPPTSFTVNLNPDEPDRIIDDRFGTTDAGRVLLEADLRMKKTVAKLINPNTSAGARYWAALHGEKKCVSSRQWIVPKTAVVHEDGNKLYILDAPLDVKMETEYVTSDGAASDAGCDSQPTTDTEYNESLYRRTILPQVQRAVNGAPEYADLRRVYASRVAAEWYRQRSRTRTTAYSRIIDSGDVSAWPTRVKWGPQDVYQAYLKSYRDGEFHIKHTTRRGNYLYTQVYVYGGVNFTRVPRDVLSTRTFTRRHPHLASSAAAARVGPVTDTATGTTWLGGSSAQRPPWDPRPAPEPPLSNPWFYVATGLPVLAWLALSGLLLRRRTRHPGVRTPAVAS